MTTGASVPERHHSDDEGLLHRLGYAQELLRSMPAGGLYYWASRLGSPA